LSFVRLPDFIRTTTFRWSLVIAGSFVLCTLLLFAFVYWQTAVYMTTTVDAILMQDAQTLAAEPPGRRAEAIEGRLRNDPRHVFVRAVFDANGQRTVGNLESLPSGLAPDVPVQAQIVRLDGNARERETVRLLVHPLDDGGTLVVGRDIEEIDEIAEIVGRALGLGLLPAFALAVGIGMILSLRGLDRLSEVNRRIKRIAAGDLRERLPTEGGGDQFDQLSLGVNHMLGEIEALIHEIANVGNDIAHELRTPLTRVRVKLERGRERAASIDELRTAVDQAIAGLDQSLAVITALLRIAEIEHSRRLERFGQVRLGPLLHEVADFYEPIAEDKGIDLRVEAADEIAVLGDRDLLFEAIANLVDNSVKFTPSGGQVRLALQRRDHDAVICVSDTGPGIPVDERDLVMKRFYRSDKSRKTEGVGLGLSLVGAIVRLHGFRFEFCDAPGCIARIICPVL
jgi:signal transduction histidine kinase